MQIELLADEPFKAGFLSERIKFAPQGMKGGNPATTGKMALNGKKIHPKKIVTMQPHDVLTLGTPGGAGFWDPKEREPERIEKDLKNELISPETAKNEYGYRS